MSVRRHAFWMITLAGLVAHGLGTADAEERVLRSTKGLPPVVGAAEIFLRDDQTGLALNGYDPLTYFMVDGPRPGSRDQEIVWAGVAWRFSSPANRVAFERNPTAFAPRIGGYDAEAASRGLIVDANPAIYLVRSGRLYLFRNDANRARFLADEALAGRAEEQWSVLSRRLVQP